MELDGRELPIRAIYGFPHVVRWIEDTLPRHEPELSHGRQDLEEQLDFLLHEYICGANIAHYGRAHIMEPRTPSIYELKSPDLRLFGWFNARCSFIVANIDTAARCKTIGLYAGYRDDTVRRRNGLDLDEPKFIRGNIEDVLHP